MKKGENVLHKIILAVVIVLAITLQAASASAWWNDSWQLRKKINLDTTVNGVALQQDLAEVTLLVRLHSGNFDFSKGKEDGGDLRFVDATDKTPLKYRMAYYSAIDQMAFFWVRVPSLKANTAENVVYLYYGNGEPTATATPPTNDVFDSATVLAYSFDEFEGLPADGSIYGNKASEATVSLGMPAVIASGASFFGKGERVVSAPSPSLNFSSGLTFSTWFRTNDPNRKAVLATLDKSGALVSIGLDNNDVVVNVAGQEIRARLEAPLAAATWHHLAVTAGNNSVAVYVNGLPVTSTPFSGKLPGPDARVMFGAGPDNNTPFVGDLDEVRLSSMVRSVDWIKAEYSCQGPQAALVQVGTESGKEAGEAAPALYFNIIVKNISIDGWAILGTLGFFAIASLTVMIWKTVAFFLNKRENDAFLITFHGDESIRGCIDADEEFHNSTLYRVYHRGCQELRLLVFPKDGDSAATEPKMLGKRDIAAFRVKLENGFLHENKDLNGWLPVLVSAISGGPFLGLLGTVWGVMNTFAAMAEAGEANIMAIAPGVASALACTVAGLLVAIPASFAYNYLLGNVREITTDLAVFIEEFVVYAERLYGADE